VGIIIVIITVHGRLLAIAAITINIIKLDVATTVTINARLLAIFAIFIDLIREITIKYKLVVKTLKLISN
jgi:hypothetical protein